IMHNNAVRIYVKNFENNRIKLGQISNIEGILELYDLDSEKAINYQFDATTGGYWLNFAAVPEPAEWAMILGSLALGFAVYRRRK
ncbi:MAG: PEP-CTERM sorting domain-containing protein, partial [Opitutales bacterium]|nr:PEP-CTERM sorting domain-containing protein [Opitutales bacterium]